MISWYLWCNCVLLLLAITQVSAFCVKIVILLIDVHAAGSDDAYLVDLPRLNIWQNIYSTFRLQLKISGFIQSNICTISSSLSTTMKEIDFAAQNNGLGFLFLFFCFLFWEGSWTIILSFSSPSLSTILLSFLIHSFLLEILLMKSIHFHNTISILLLWSVTV